MAYIDPYSGMVFPDGNLPVVHQGLQNPPIIGQNFTFSNGPRTSVIEDMSSSGYSTFPKNGTAATATGTGKLKGLKNWFSGLNLGNSGWRLTGREGSLGIGNTGGKAGLTIGGKNVGKLGVGIGAGIDAVKSIKSISDMNDARTDYNNLASKIKASAAGNPMLSSYLTSDQMSQLNKIKRGATNSDSGASIFNSGLLSGGLKGALSGLAMGGLPGAAVGAIAGGVKGGLENKNSQVQSNTQSLEGLYQSLQDAEAQYKRMRTPNYPGLGLQSRYTNQWM